MILGRIIGKATTNLFEFTVEKPINKFDYCQVFHKDYGYVLCQVVELEKTSEKVLGKAIVLGYKDERGNIKQLRSPLDINTEILKADEDFIKSIVIGNEDTKSGAFLGRLEGTDINVFLELNKLLTKHVAVLAKSGSGKSYSVGVLLEEIIERNIPLLIIDPHGEYSSLKKENDKQEDIEKLEKLNLKKKSYIKKVTEYGDYEINPKFKPIKLNHNLTTQELIDLLPTKLTNNQLGLLYSTIKNMEELTFDSLLVNLESTDSNLKWNLISTIEYLKGFKIFSSYPTSYNELVQPGKASIINLKGMEPEVQEILVYKLLKDLFTERKKGNVPPFFLIIEEAHNFVPEKGFSDAKSSKIIKNIASEGRKFGLGMCVVTQRPAMVQKTVLSQCNTQMILKVTNPNDLKAVSSSVEGLTNETENEIKNLPIGTALVTGVVDKPLLVNVRPRKSMHGGEAVDILTDDEQESDFVQEVNEYKSNKITPLILPKITKEDYRLMTGKEEIKTVLIPCVLFSCKNRTIEYNLLIEMNEGGIVLDIDDTELKTAHLPELESLTKTQLKLLEKAYNLKEFTITDIIGSSGLSFDVKEDLADLTQKGFIIKNNENKTFGLNEKYIFSNPAKKAFYGKIEYKSAPSDVKIEKKIRLDVMKAKISKFTNILDNKECYLVHYK
ncbi:MAG: ATP-binding protein [Nanobdellota archaeon]